MNETKFLDRINEALNDYHNENTLHQTLSVRIEFPFECYEVEFIVYHNSTKVLFVIPKEITKFEMIGSEFNDERKWDDYLVGWNELEEYIKEKLLDQLSKEVYTNKIPDNGEPFTVCDK